MNWSSNTSTGTRPAFSGFGGFGSSANSLDIPPEIRLNDTQLISDLPPSVQEKFREVYEELTRDPPAFLDTSNAEIDMKALNLRVKEITKNAKRRMIARLKAVARQHDLYDSRLKSLKEQLSIFRDDLRDQRPIVKRPTRFITNFVDDVHKMYLLLQRDITAYGNYLGPRQETVDDSTELSELIKAESGAIMGIAIQLGELSDNIGKVRAQLIGIARGRVAVAEADMLDKPSLARDVDRRFQQYERDIRRRAQKRNAGMSFFGEMPPLPAPAQKTGFTGWNFGAGAGGGGFGTGIKTPGIGFSYGTTNPTPPTPKAGETGPFSRNK